MDDDDDVREELIKCSNEILSKNQVRSFLFGYM